MSAVLTSFAPWSSDLLEHWVADRTEPGWFQSRRLAAVAEFTDRLNRSLDPEEWKRIDLRAFRREKFRLMATAQSTGADPTALSAASDFVGRIHHSDGHCVGSTLAPEHAERGVIWGTLADVLSAHPELIEQYFMTEAVRPDTDRFSAWHAAFCTGGTVLYVPREVRLDRPLHSLIELATAGAADLSHTLVILEAGAAATLLEETISHQPGDAGLHVGCVELLVGPGAHLQYVQLQNWNEQTWHFAHQSGRVAEGGTLQWTVGALGSRVSHIHQDVHLDGRNASGEVNGVSFATDRQLLSFYTQQTHHAPQTRSDLLYKDVLRDDSRVVWRGMIKVDPGAQKTDGYQRNDALLLSDDCRTDLIPGLEIEADDVRCTHGATAGQVDAEQLFYAMCRGLTRAEAMHVIVEGFFQRVFDRISVESVRETLSRSVQQKLGLLG
jgi:Fe-S cluster assembly protein SufD